MKIILVFVILAHISQNASGVEVVVYEEEEESVLLPCQRPAPLSKDDVVVWRRDDLNPAIVHTLIEEHSDLRNQNPRYTNRTSVQKEALQTGDLSLFLRNPTISDSGTYTCTTRSFGEDRTTTEVQLKVKGPPPRWPKVLAAVLVSLVFLVIAAGVFLGLVYKRMKKTEGFQVKIVKVTEGADSVVLPFESKKCRRKDVRVEWTRIQDKEVKVIVYERGHAQHQKKDKFFRRRSSMKKDPWATGVANLTLRNLCFDDGGVYICTVYKDEKVLEKKVVVLLVKEGWLKTIKGLFQSGTESGGASTAPGSSPLTQQLSSLQSLSDLP
ncbi:uncharacterized protein LOC115774506 [Archocentrus centrarchus]|uniref:uncharacterized protein LOC115774506 n=1 Tax=Archocentrus centrarchus TaxID=63155 RepID=UPI0011E9C44B|nr:uncharacterized protein LOC115774506 [Archocentrus centrarchus]